MPSTFTIRQQHDRGGLHLRLRGEFDGSKETTEHATR